MELKDFFAQVEVQYKDKLPFVVYRKPDVGEVKAILQNDDVLFEVEDYHESGFVFAPFDDQLATPILPFDNSEIIVANVSIQKQKERQLEDSQEIHLQRKDTYLKLIEKAIDAIKAEQFQKVVLSRYEEVALPKKNPIAIFKDLLSHYKKAFVYCWYHPKVGLWLGATPEALLKVNGKRITTMALAGTQKYEGTTDVIWQNKEKHEQQLVTDFIAGNLKPVTASLAISDVQTLKAGNLLHLKTSISGILNDENLAHAIKALHPTPAVCGFPGKASKKFILENENYKREFYTGYLGELNFKETRTRNTNRRNVENSAYQTVKTVSNLYVNLRCMQIQESHARVYVGGGITHASIPDSEWQETINKAQTIKAILS